ncbi:MAG: tetratricopeptide repeat protein, partial [Candidatus Hydrogenedens sp.]|nr:tetratricopeptide repeat protein [Candidatus Hydrogenedens sp.]
MHIHVQSAPPDPEGKAYSENSWFDVPENDFIYAFVGGGNLYGWFSGNRHKDYGAGITGLVHSDYPWKPIFQQTSLNFEHIFSGKTENADRSLFTVRTDPMHFTVDAPNQVRIRWDRERSSWDLGCEMVYTFPGDDAIDMSFSFTIEEEQASVDYLGFMWASYMHNAKKRGISFPVKKGGEREWFFFSPLDPSEHKGANVVASPDAGNLPYDPHTAILNIENEKDLTLDAPYYYGEVYQDLHRLDFEDIMYYVMMFQKEEGLRYTVFNWGPREHYSVWDWQYILAYPEAGKDYRYLMRCLITSSVSEEKLEGWYRRWIASLDDDSIGRSQESAIVSFPELPLYWYPACFSMGLSFMGRQIAPVCLDQALEWSRYQLTHFPEDYAVALDIDNFYMSNGDVEGLIAEWEEQAKTHSDSALPWLHLGKAYAKLGKHYEADRYFFKAQQIKADDPSVLLYSGINQIHLHRFEDGFRQIKVALQGEYPQQSMAIALLDECGLWLREEGDLADTSRFYEEVSARFPDELWYVVRLAECLEVMGEEDQALELYVDVLLQAPESPYSAHKLDSLLQKKEDAFARISIWKEIHEENENSYVTSLHLGLALFDHHSYEKALALFEKASSISPDQPRALLYEGLCRVLLGEEEK